MEITCADCVLRPLVAGDATRLAEHANDRDIWRNLRDRFPHPYTVQDADSYIALVAARMPQKNFGIVVNGEACGTIGLLPGEDIARCTAEIGYWLGRRFWGRGIATQALVAATSYAFSTLGLQRVFAEPFTQNAASLRVLTKAEYTLEGLMRRSAIKDGEVLDQYLYAAYRDRWTRAPIASIA